MNREHIKISYFFTKLLKISGYRLLKILSKFYISKACKLIEHTDIQKTCSLKLTEKLTDLSVLICPSNKSVKITDLQINGLRSVNNFQRTNLLF